MTGIIDYGMGNLHSVCNALAFLGEETIVSADPALLSGCSRLILPGVGAFPDAMKALNETGLSVFLKEAAQTKYLLGICLGMQLLFDRSHEFCLSDGLGLIPGEVIRLTAAERSRTYKIPHMGWNNLCTVNESPLLCGAENRFVYFVHSYKAEMGDRRCLIASANYGEEIPAIVSNRAGNVFGMQFHPEKSEQAGLTLLSNFLALR